MRMQTARNSQHWQLFAILCAGLATALAAGSVTAVTHQSAARHAVHDQAALGQLHQDHARYQGTAGAPPADLAVRLQALLGEHSVLAADLMRSRIRGDDDFVQAANAALGENTDAMTDLVGQLFGKAAADKFSPMWSEHIVTLFSYAGALAAQDAAAQADARKELVEYEQELGDFFAAASRRRLPQKAARGAIVQHVGHLTAQAD